MHAVCYLQGICDSYNVDVITLLSHWLYIPPAELFHTNRIVNHALQNDADPTHVNAGVIHMQRCACLLHRNLS